MKISFKTNYDVETGMLECIMNFGNYLAELKVRAFFFSQ